MALSPTFLKGVFMGDIFGSGVMGSMQDGLTGVLSWGPVMFTIKFIIAVYVVTELVKMLRSAAHPEKKVTPDRADYLGE